MKSKKRLERGAGILLPISSLPSIYGIGSLGKSAYDFVDFLKEARQRYWQILPIGPTGYGDSPYQSFSAFAGNPYFIDLPWLFEQGLLTAEELLNAHSEEEGGVDYEWLYRTRFSLLKAAASRFADTPDFLRFEQEEREWLDGYAVFMAAKERFNHCPWQEWDEDLRVRNPQKLTEFCERYGENIRFWKCCQYWFFTQWHRLKEYANKAGVNIIGDIPIYVSADSSDVWEHPMQFFLDEEGYPSLVAGVPPDAFSADGQRWGNPLYRYDLMEKDGFSWWKKRMAHCARLFDVVRIDHFIGFARYYAIPAQADSAKEGQWVESPGEGLTKALDSVSRNCRLIAENLGVLHPSVQKLLKKTGYPGMCILQFAFDGNAKNAYLPHNYHQNTVVYGGTHDNETLEGFLKTLRGKEKEFLLQYLGIKQLRQAREALIRLAYGSVADVVIFQMQDILGLNNTARMNTPSTLGENWCWRMKKDQLIPQTAQQLCRFSEIYGRG